MRQRGKKNLPLMQRIREFCKRLAADEVNRTFKVAMLVIGNPAAEVDGISGHSIRVGAAQDLRDADMTLLELMGSGGWSDTKMPALYTRKQAARRSGMAKLMAKTAT